MKILLTLFLIIGLCSCARPERQIVQTYEWPEKNVEEMVDKFMGRGDAEDIISDYHKLNDRKL